MTVITTFPYYPEWEVPKDYAGRLTAEEERKGVRLLRSYVYARPRPTAILRALFYLSFTLSCLPNLIKAGKHDVVLVMSPPPTLVFSALVSRALHRARLVLDVQDIVPDAAVIFGMMRNPFLIAIFRWVERLCYRLADHIIVVADNFAPNLHRKGVPPRKISVIYNWIDTTLFRPLPRQNDWRSHLPLMASDFVVLYAGNMGLSQGLDIVIDAAKLISETRPDVKFVFVGGGSTAAELRKIAASRSPGNTLFVPPQPFETMPAVQAIADVSLVVQKANVLDINFPSKIPAIMASGRPIIGVVNHAGDAASVLAAAHCAILVPPGDCKALAAAVLTLYMDPHKRASLSQNARQYAEAHFSEDAAVERYEQVLHDVASPNPH